SRGPGEPGEGHHAQRHDLCRLPRRACLARTPRDVLWLQIPNAVATATLLGLAISDEQASIKGQVGLSTSIFDVMTVLATTLAAGGFRLFLGEASYLTGFVAAAGSSLLGAALLWVSERKPGAP
ncbi:MAG: hypothetical protein KDK53_23065, partial [Maritimibacter sp.]|nr:hypothetical protein [Maritimibacter sp.]